MSDFSYPNHIHVTEVAPHAHYFVLAESFLLLEIPLFCVSCL